MVPFAAPALSQLSAIQAALVPVSCQILGTTAEVRALREVDRNIPKGEFDKSAFITRAMGEPGYLFRYENDPPLFARLIVRSSENVGSDFEICRMWRGPWPSAIAFHMAGLMCVKTLLFINLRDLILPAGGGGEYVQVKDLKRNSSTANLIGNLLWAGCGVFPE